MKLLVVYVVGVVGIMWLCGGVYDKGKEDGIKNVRIQDWSPRLPYRQFFKEERKTDSPIWNVYIKDEILYVVTKDGTEDMIILKTVKR